MPGSKGSRGGKTSNSRNAVISYDTFRNADAGQMQAIAETVEKVKNDPNQQPSDHGEQKFFNAIGWASRVPELVATEEELQDIAGKEGIMYHTDSPFEGVEDAQVFADQYMGDGRQFMSHGIFGAGTYFTNDKQEAYAYGDGEKAYQIAGVLNKKARIIDTNSLLDKMNDLRKKDRALYEAIEAMHPRKLGSQEKEVRSIFAAYFGYNVIDSTPYASWQDMHYYTILDRSATTVSRRGYHADGTPGEYKRR